MDHYEVRKWKAWRRYVTLSLLAHAYLVVARSSASGEQEEAGEKGGSRSSPELIPLTVPEMRRLILAVSGPQSEREFRLGWSLWRRAHQAVAARCHAAKRALRHEGALPREPLPVERVPVRVAAELTDAEWESVRLLLPHKPPTGRPYHEHRMVLGGILWVMRTGSSWREMPEEEFGKWQTAYRRYRLWLEQGLWKRILEALGEQRYPGPATKGGDLSL